MKIYVIKAFSDVFQYCWEKNYLFLFPSKTHKKFPARKIKSVGFQASCKVSSQQAEERQFSTSYVKMGVAKRLEIHPSVGGAGSWGKPPSFSGFFTRLHIIAFITARINLHLISFPQFIRLLSYISLAF